MNLKCPAGRTALLEYRNLTVEGIPPEKIRWYSIISMEGSSFSIPGYYDGKCQNVRYMLPREGIWKYRSFLEGTSDPFDEGDIECTPGRDTLSGGLKIDPSNPKRFILADNRPVFLMSYEANWLWALETEYPGSGRLDRFLKKIKSFGFNSVLMNAYAHDTTWCRGRTTDRDYGPPGIYPWKGSNEAPDFSGFNYEYWHHFDAVVQAFQDNGIILHLYFKVFNKMVNWPVQGSVEEEEYFRYIVARYQAFSCMIWDFSKESYYEKDMNLLTKLMSIVKDRDGYGRLRTVHDYPAYYETGDARRILDFNTAQQHNNFFDATILEHGKRNWPFLNAEFGYECGDGGTMDVSYGAGQSPQCLIERAWEVVLGGAYPAYYYTYTAWDIINEEDTPRGYEYFRIMADFFREHDFNSFRPFLNHCLWRSTYCAVRGEESRPEELILYVEHHALMTPEISFENYKGEWLNIYTGEKRALTSGMVSPCADEKTYSIYTSPFNALYSVLYLKRRGS